MITVIFYRTNGGNEPVRDWLRALAPDDRKTIGEDLKTVQLGWPVGMPLCRSLGSGLYEVRSDISDKRIARLIFFQHGDKLVLVEAFIKKSQTTPKTVLELAHKRKREVERR